MQEIARGTLSKLIAQNEDTVRYTLPVGPARLDLNPLLGQPVALAFTGRILCCHCGRQTRKSFGQGHCYPCFTKLAACDSCIMSPEKCHFDAGTCREPDWAMTHCMTEHVVYLANSSGLKVGITRGSQVPTRWIDQGAIQAIPMYRVDTRQQAGFVEHVLRDHVSDRTNWRTMLKGEVAPIDLQAERSRLLEASAAAVDALRQRFGDGAIRAVDEAPVSFHYPVNAYPAKVTSFDFDKQPVVEGRLAGIKGQYLLLDTGVINIRKFTAYEITVSA